MKPFKPTQIDTKSNIKSELSRYTVNDITSSNTQRIGSIENIQGYKAGFIDDTKIMNSELPFVIEGIEFSYNSPTINKIYWTTGTLKYKNAQGTWISKTITAEATGVLWTTGTLYVYWVRGTSAFTTSTTQPTGQNYVIATYKGGTDFVIAYGREIKDGSKITTQTITGKKLNYIVDDSDTNIVYNVGTWTVCPDYRKTSCFNNSLRYCNSSGEYVEYTFWGTSIGIFIFQDKNGAPIEIKIDNIVDSSYNTTVLDGALADDANGNNGSATDIDLIDASGFPSSGTIWIGTQGGATYGVEGITYTGKTVNKLTGITRGVYGSRSAHANGINVGESSQFSDTDLTAGNTYNPEVYRNLFYFKDGLTEGSHTIRMTHKGTSKSYMYFDAFAVNKLSDVTNLNFQCRNFVCDIASTTSVGTIFFGTIDLPMPEGYTIIGVRSIWLRNDPDGTENQILFYDFTPTATTSVEELRIRFFTTISRTISNINVDVLISKLKL